MLFHEMLHDIFSISLFLIGIELGLGLELVRLGLGLGFEIHPSRLVMGFKLSFKLIYRSTIFACC